MGVWVLGFRDYVGFRVFVVLGFLGFSGFGVLRLWDVGASGFRVGLSHNPICTLLLRQGPSPKKEQNPTVYP